MYVTIVCADKVSRCVSYEGQGVSNEFNLKYAYEIFKNKHKIKNICGEKDFVSPLLINIAGETVYVVSDSSILNDLLDHGAYGIFTANREILKDNGGYFPESAYVEQAWYCKAIHTLTVALSFSNAPELELFADLAGIIVGLVISKDWTDPKIVLKAFEDLIKAIEDYKTPDIVEGLRDGCIEALRYMQTHIVEWMKSAKDYTKGYAILNSQIVVDTYKLDSYAQRLRAVNTRINNLDKRLNSLYGQVGLLDLWNLMQADVLTCQSLRLSRCASYLSDTASDFNSVENNLVNKSQ